MENKEPEELEKLAMRSLWGLMSRDAHLQSMDQYCFLVNFLFFLFILKIF